MRHTNPEMEMMMDIDRVKGSFDQAKGKVREKSAVCPATRR